MKRTTKYFKEVSNALATAKADEVEVKNSSSINRREYIKNEATSIQKELTTEYKKLCSHIKKSSKVLEEEVQNLPKVEQERIQKEIKSALRKIENVGEELDEPCLQTYLGLSNETLFWIYETAYNSYQNNRHEEAQDLFFLLVLFNPMVRDYWMALGHAYNARCFYDKAQEAFSLASFLDPEYAPSRYQSAQLYLEAGAFEDALAELAVLEEILNKEEDPSLRAQFEKLRTRARNKS